MYLKEIQASGFKSFADKLNIVLDDNITCIVGPNGSGKSNVVDAVRWVLGEQSVKSLRGDGSMTDVIFSGSKSRNSLNVASVCLVFDNSDNYLKVPYTEVSIKRRVYRTGENEYFLNGEKCRLKDITDLFMDSGIGKESFNIISQGEVQKILSNSPYDRRVVFEEAAEVLKYKKRKEEAIRKLDRTDNNLDRVNDIINELEVQLEPLKEQSTKAKEYLENKKLLENIEVALIAYEIENLNNEYQESKKKIETLHSEIVSLSTNSSGSDAKIDNEKVNLLKLEKEINEYNQKLLTLTRQEEKLNGEKNILKERSKYDASEMKVHENITLLKENELKLKNDISLLEQEINVNQEALKEKLEFIRSLDSEIKSLEEKENSYLREENFKKKDNYDLDNKISVLENFIENGGNLPNSIKSIMNNPRLNGIHDVIGNLVTIDYKFSKALDIALGASKQFLVVDNEMCAKDAINYLKENKLGRCTFFPINVIKPKTVDSETLNILRSEMGYIDTVANMASCSKEYKNIIYNQLGNVLLVTDIDAANRISKRINNRYKIVTIDGEVIHVGGSITGGIISSSRNMFSDKQELERLKKQKNSNFEVIRELEEKSQSILKEKESIISKKDGIQSEYILEQEKINGKNNTLLEYRERLDSTTRELNSLSHVVDSSISKEEERIMNEFYDTQKEKQETELMLRDTTKKRDNLKAMIEEIEAKNKLNNSNLNKKQNELKDLEIKVSKMDVKLDYYLNTLSEDYELTFEKAKEKYQLEIEVEEARVKVNTYKNNIKKIGMVNLASIEEYDKVSERYNFLDGQKKDLLEAKDTLLEIISEMDEVMKEEFLKTFKQIQVEFEGVFKQLFGGGRASLKLTDPDNILETGVEIIASPPGKKLTTISLLSGGEKTLTAISLLFAILNVRPIPFCIFDEVEAALDEANVDNFGKYLDHYKTKTQFLLITHKKKTMEYANTLYGITMQESGVSKLVSVKLENK